VESGPGEAGVRRRAACAVMGLQYAAWRARWAATAVLFLVASMGTQTGSYAVATEARKRAEKATSKTGSKSDRRYSAVFSVDYSVARAFVYKAWRFPAIPRYVLTSGAIPRVDASFRLRDRSVSDLVRDWADVLGPRSPPPRRSGCRS
jgi:hypothetical protein